MDDEEHLRDVCFQFKLHAKFYILESLFGTFKYCSIGDKRVKHGQSVVNLWFT